MLYIPEFTKIPRAVAIDLDGTLLDSQTQLSERSRQALKNCFTHKIPVIIATSRPARIFNRIFPKELTEGCSLVLMNGSIAEGHPPLSGYFKQELPEDVAREIIKIARGFNANVRITIEVDGYEFGANWTADAATLWQRNSATPNMIISIEEALNRKLCKVALGGLDNDILMLHDILVSEIGDKISIVPALFGNPLLNITAPPASKPAALRKLLKPGISLHEVIAFGDDLPDIGMLQECGTSVAMANAIPEVKSVSKYETLSNDEDGVALVLERMLDDYPYT